MRTFTSGSILSLLAATRNCKPLDLTSKRYLSNVQYKNRNPRNLELLGLAPKRKGWEFQSPRIDYWHKVYLEKTAHHTTGIVVHSSNSVVTSASTREPSIQKHLYSCVDVSAAENIGHILAYRCLQCGLVSLFFDTVEASLTNESIKAFYDALLEGGLTLQEPDEIAPPEPLGIDYDGLTDQEKRALYPSLIENLRTIPDWNDIKYPYSLRPRAGKVKLRSQYQILSKIRQGMVWDPFYKRMVLPQNKAHWQHDLEQRHLKHLEEPIDTLEQEESIPVAVPKKWLLE
ncbi:ribosomal L18p/L5e family protein, partial [Opisthorchis viverrini]